MSREIFLPLLEAARALYAARPALTGFADWPDDLAWAGLEPLEFPISGIIQNWVPKGAGLEADLHRALGVAARFARWQQTYSQAEVGAHFLENYGFIELFGPTGQFHSVKARAFIASWGPGLSYDWHRHEAEETYYVVSGSAYFQSERAPDQTLGRGGTRLHSSNQPHAMQSSDEAVLCFVSWRGAGLDGSARLGRN